MVTKTDWNESTFVPVEFLNKHLKINLSFSATPGPLIKVPVGKMLLSFAEKLELFEFCMFLDDIS